MTAAREADGESKTRLHNIWTHMRNRCSNPDDPAFARYGGRGISVCEEWQRSYIAFRDWARENGYASHLTIDRVDNDGPYHPSNCKWSTYAEQNRNTRRNRPIEYQGKKWLVCDLAAAYGLPQDIVKNRVFRYGWNIEKALTTPVAVRTGVPVWKQAGASSSTTYYRKRAAISFEMVKP
jgi:hypothetical protein